MGTGLTNLINKLRPDLFQKLEEDSPYYDAKPFIIPRDEEGNIIEFEQPDPKPFMIPRDEEGNIIPFDPNEGIQLLGSEEKGRTRTTNVAGQELTEEEQGQLADIHTLTITGGELYRMKLEKLGLPTNILLPMDKHRETMDALRKLTEEGRGNYILDKDDPSSDKGMTFATGGIIALKRGGKANKKTAKEKKVATARYKKVKKAGEAARAKYQADRADIQDRARSNQGNNQNNKQENRISQAEETRLRLLKEAQEARDKGEKYVIDPELFTQNKAGRSNVDPTGKLREGMTGAEYHDFMRKLHGANPAAMQKAFPWSSGKALGNIAKLAIPAPIRWGLDALKKAGQFEPVKNLRTMGKDFKNLGLDALRTAGQLGPVKELTKMFGLDGLHSKLVNIAGDETTKQYNDIIKGQQAYDPSGLEGYKDKIYRDLFKQVNKNTLGPYGDPNPAFGTDQLDIFDIPLNDEVDESYGNTVYNPAFGEYDLRNAEKGHNYNVGKPISMGALDTEEPLSITYDENINERWKKLFPNVSETKYKKPEDVITQENISTDLLTPINQPEQIGVYTDGTPMYAEDQTDIFNAGSFPEMNIFGNEVGGPRHHLLNQINKLGNADSASEKKAKAILNSLGQANGGYMSNFPNQKMGTQSLTASDNIDDRIMKNLQFEKMAPGMMGYNQGGKVMSTFEKLKAIADNNYG